MTVAIVGTSEFGYFYSGRIPQFQRIEGNRATLLEDYRFAHPSGELWIARKGLTYDGASIPRLFWGLSTNPWADDVIGPATIHDQYCALGRQGLSPYDSDAVHYAFYLGLRAIGVSSIRARARWIAVRTRGPQFTAAVESDNAAA